MRVFAIAVVMFLTALVHAEQKGDVLRPVYTKARALVRRQPLPEALRKEILQRMKTVKANFARPGTRIEYNEMIGKDAAFIELDHGDEASELSVSLIGRHGHVITAPGRDRLGWMFFPAAAEGTDEILRVDRGYNNRGAEWYRVTAGQVAPIDKAQGEKLEREHRDRENKSILERLKSQ